MSAVTPTTTTSFGAMKPPRGPLRRVGGGLLWALRQVYPLIVVLVIWYVVAEARVVIPLALPSPLAVWDAFLRGVSERSLLLNGLITTQRIVTAFGIAILVGVPLGLMIGRIPVVRALARPIMSFLFPAPKSALFPAFLVIFGLGGESKVALGFALAVFQVVIAAAAASSQLDERLIWSARALGTSRVASFVRVVLPPSLPGILTGARIALMGSLVGVFLGELLSGADGLGQVMTRARAQLDSPTVYAVMILTALIGVILDRLVLAVRRLLVFWTD